MRCATAATTTTRRSPSMVCSVPPLPPFPFPVPSTCMWCASAILNNVVARWVHSGVASQPGGGSAAYRVRLRRLLLVAREQAAGPLPATDRPPCPQKRKRKRSFPLLSGADRKDGPQPRLLLQVWNPEPHTPCLGLCRRARRWCSGSRRRCVRSGCTWGSSGRRSGCRCTRACRRCSSRPTR